VTRPLSILIAHPSPLYRQGIELALRDLNVRYRSTHCDHLRDLRRHWQPESGFDLLLLDDCLPGLSCLCKLTDLAKHPGAAVLLCSGVTDRSLIARFRCAGLRGLLPASMRRADLAAALAQLEHNTAWIEPAKHPATDPGLAPGGLSTPSLQRLTATELRVLRSLGEGRANKQIAVSLNLSVHTVKTHMSNIFRKLDVNNRTHLVMSVQQLRLPA
jgi:DNA-binding NarL/FixJ family response regulator